MQIKPLIFIVNFCIRPVHGRINSRKEHNVYDNIKTGITNVFSIERET